MASDFFMILIDGKPTRFEKRRVIEIAPYPGGTKLTIEASHTEEEPLIYFTPEEYDMVMKSYLG
ncbi:hypothetical protein [Arcticibacter sp. MXS-1]|uniref:hypothetical protein n=1 Tax=Arcticibacter sp. MXS-1 TaxID=3341726 RepID=UPI0035A96458